MGVYADDVEVHIFHMPDGIIVSLTDAEELPSPERVGQLLAAGAMHTVLTANPKIVMDDGSVVYGCQVWWQFTI